VAQAPAAWIEALGLDGRLGVIERDGPVGKAVVYVRTAQGAGRRELFDATPPVLPGFAREPKFAF
jgi:protein-L-isoaspartate(D-aspartate) O-methyltransferase